MKNLLFVAIATSLAIPPTGLLAKRPDIVVSSGRSIDNFVEDVATDLNRELNRYRHTTGLYEGTGVAQVLFECSPDGKPTKITMYSRSRYASVDRRARNAVSKIRTLHPLPQGVGQDQLYLANIIIADDLDEFDQLSAELKQREAKRIAAAKGDRKIFAFTLGQSPST